MSMPKMNTPEDFADDLYWDFSEFENLTTEEVKKCCYKVIKRLRDATDNVPMKLYYAEAKNLIERRGK